MSAAASASSSAAASSASSPLISIKPATMAQLLAFEPNSKLRKHQKLAEFVHGVWQMLSACNQSPATDSKPLALSILDTHARLHVGDETCAAIAFSGDRLLLATNRNSHVSDHITFSVIGKVTACDLTTPYQTSFTLVLQCVAKVQAGSSQWILHKESQPLTYQVDHDGVSYRICSQPEVKFEFSQDEHGIDSVAFPIGLAVTAHTFWRAPAFPKIGLLWPVLTSLVIWLDPLHRRTARIGQQLALVGHSVRYPSMQNRIAPLLNEARAWILHSSLTYELAKTYKQINPYDFSANANNAMSPMLTLYSKLCASLDQFRASRATSSSTSLPLFVPPSVVRVWWQESVDGELLSFEPPEFIKANSAPFLTLAKSYFLDLLHMEMYAFVDAVDGGELSQVLSQFNPLENAMPVEIVDVGADGKHAEMRLLMHHLRSGKPERQYFGISKLCCGYCNFAFVRFKAHADRRRAHGALFGGWLIGEFEKSNEMLKTLFGASYPAFDELCKEPSIKLDDGRTIACRTLALSCFQSLAGLNSTEFFKSPSIKELELPGGLLVAQTKSSADQLPRASDLLEQDDTLETTWKNALAKYQSIPAVSLSAASSSSAASQTTAVDPQMFHGMKSGFFNNPTTKKK